MSLRELRRLWGQRKQSLGPSDPGGYSSQQQCHELKPSLPLLQVWPSQDSPKSNSETEAFVFPPNDAPSLSAHHDSGIDSVQASPCGASASPRPSISSPLSLLHPDHARLLRRPSSPEISIDEPEPGPTSASSSASSLASAAAVLSPMHRELWERHRRRSSTMTARSTLSPIIYNPSKQQWERDRRRSSTMSARYSLLDALDLEYALLRAAARGSVGPYSFSESIHKLTFTQSLAFPGLARGLAGKRRTSTQTRATASDTTETGLNAFAKIVTALVLMLVSVMVFGVVYKFVKT